MGTKIFECPTLGENVYASVQLRGDWERLIVCSIDDKMAEEKFRTAYKLLRREKNDFFLFHKNVNF